MRHCMAVIISRTVVLISIWWMQCRPVAFHPTSHFLFLDLWVDLHIGASFLHIVFLIFRALPTNLFFFLTSSVNVQWFAVGLPHFLPKLWPHVEHPLANFPAPFETETERGRGSGGHRVERLGLRWVTLPFVSFLDVQITTFTSCYCKNKIHWFNFYKRLVSILTNRMNFIFECLLYRHSCFDRVVLNL